MGRLHKEATTLYCLIILVTGHINFSMNIVPKFGQLNEFFGILSIDHFNISKFTMKVKILGYLYNYEHCSSININFRR